MSEWVDVSDLSGAEILAVLYNASRPLGMGFMHYDKTPMTIEEAQGLIADGDGYFDYLKGRVMKIKLGNPLNIRLYDRDNGEGAAQKALDAYRATRQTNAPEIAAAHAEGRTEAAFNVRSRWDTKTEMTEPGVVRMGLAEVRDKLEPKVDEALSDVKSEPTEDEALQTDPPRQADEAAGEAGQA